MCSELLRRPLLLMPDPRPEYEPQYHILAPAAVQYLTETHLQLRKVSRRVDGSEFAKARGADVPRRLLRIRRFLEERNPDRVCYALEMSERAVTHHLDKIDERSSLVFSERWPTSFSACRASKRLSSSVWTSLTIGGRNSCRFPMAMFPTIMHFQPFVSNRVRGAFYLLRTRRHRGPLRQ